MIVLGTRGSALALAQTDFVRTRLLSIFPASDIAIRVIKTSADHDMNKSIRAGSSVGVFVKELEQALLSGEIDLAVPAASDWTVLRHYHRPCALHQTTGQRCVVRREAGAFLTDPGQLNQSGIITVTVAGTAGAELARTWLPRARHESFPALPQALARLRATDGAVLLTDARQAWELARANADLALVFPIQGVESLAWAVRDDPDGQGWAAYLDYFLAEAQADGRLARWLSETGADLVTSSPGTAPAASPAGN